MLKRQSPPRRPLDRGSETALQNYLPTFFQAIFKHRPANFDKFWPRSALILADFGQLYQLWSTSALGRIRPTGKSFSKIAQVSWIILCASACRLRPTLA